MSAEGILEEQFKEAIKGLRRGAEEETGVYLTKCECEILLLKLRSSVDIFPLIAAFHNLIDSTLQAWRDKPEKNDLAELKELLTKNAPGLARVRP